MKFSIIPVFLLSEAYYVLHFIGLTSWCTGTSSGYYSACYYICRQVGEWLFKLEMLLIAPLIMAIWFLTIQKQGKLIVGLRFFGIMYLLFLRFAIASMIGELKIVPCRWSA
ncbi:MULTISPECIES: hypothetical protein [unclassified Tolypothrix]|uniref:hypothetical protein n=1 Tax=unclassified Tolypothrix TaxID=2649714 RepID=UPI0012D74A7F|nr:MULTISPECIES: hypothetical protein [unclassified Tolypothrix]MBE9084312.1 hypothetical protein [Tolypothrix sp. LEGE 11397]UYD25704.1 hypothetical protein HGR01_30930 [Tolypothrix sp. PCC 7712]UYD32055.1 hypothetical protein HG267_23605 [Tolypothrix sp. PCC 7601]